MDCIKCFFPRHVLFQFTDPVGMSGLVDPERERNTTMPVIMGSLVLNRRFKNGGAPFVICFSLNNPSVPSYCFILMLNVKTTLQKTTFAILVDFFRNS